jgi:cysteine sulfinate desulfinase/cysteine desulfurase-like protein
VLSALNPTATGAAIRFSFSKNNTKEEIDRVLEVLERLVK